MIFLSFAASFLVGGEPGGRRAGGAGGTLVGGFGGLSGSQGAHLPPSFPFVPHLVQLLAFALKPQGQLGADAPTYLPLQGSSFQGASLLQCGQRQLFLPGGRRGWTTL